jgi:hypothetical protein
MSELHHGVLHDIEGIGLMAQRDLCDPEGLALNLGQKRLESARTILGRFTQMCFPKREQIGCLWSKINKRKHLQGTAAEMESGLTGHNGAQRGLVDTCRPARKLTEIIHLFDPCQITVTRSAPERRLRRWPGCQGIDPERKCRLIRFSSI